MASGSGPQLSTVATFPPGFLLENIAGDTSANGVFITVANRPELYFVPPPSSPEQASTPALIETYSRYQFVMGIISAPQSPNAFYILTTNGPAAAHSLSWITNNQLRVLDTSNPALGCHSIAIMTFPCSARALNGFCALSPTTLLAADSFASKIWRIDLDTSVFPPKSARCRTWLKDPTMRGRLVLPDFMPGINGLKFSPMTGYVYYTCTQQQNFCRVRVAPDTLAPWDRPEVMATGWHFDDFIIDDREGQRAWAYATTHRDNSVVKIPLDRPDMESTMTETEAVVQGGNHDLRFLGPTAGGHEGEVAWFLTDGGLKNPAEDGLVRCAKLLRVVL